MSRTESAACPTTSASLQAFRWARLKVVVGLLAAFTLLPSLAAGQDRPADGPGDGPGHSGTDSSKESLPRPFFACGSSDGGREGPDATALRSSAGTGESDLPEKSRTVQITPSRNEYRDLYRRTTGKGLKAARGSDDDENFVLRHRYSSNQAWNSNGKAVFLSRGNLLVHGPDFSKTTHVPELAGRVAQFLPDDPSLMLATARDGTTIDLFDPFERKVRRAFSLRGFSDFRINTRSSVSADGLTAAVKANDMSSGEHKCLLVDLHEEKVVSAVSYRGSGFLNARNKERRCFVSPSGKFMVVDGRREDRIHGNAVVYDRSGQFVRGTPDNSGVECAGGHGDFGMTREGDDVLVGVCKRGGGKLSERFGGSTVARYLSSGEYRALGKGVSHVSCRNTSLPGWCIGSSFGKRGSSIVAIDLSSDRTIELGSSMVEERAVYLDEPHAVPDPSGTRILFASRTDEAGDPGIGAYVLHVKRCV